MSNGAADLTDPEVLRKVTRRAGLRIDRRLGQHFLVDRAVLDTIVTALQLPSSASVLEIGCGAGTLTLPLAEAALRVLAIDIDPACVRATTGVTAGHPGVTVLHADARQVDPSSFGLAQPWWAAGNLPYHLTGVLLSRLFELPAPPEAGVFLVQREVAARLSAGRGDWSLATVAVRSIATVERLLDVPPDAFMPPPAVHSSVIRLRPLRILSPATRAAVIALARLVFQQRRKTLRHGVMHALHDNGPGALSALDAAGIDPRRRPGTLSLDEWQSLAAAVAAVSQAAR